MIMNNQVGKEWINADRPNNVRILTGAYMARFRVEEREGDPIKTYAKVVDGWDAMRSFQIECLNGGYEFIIANMKECTSDRYCEDTEEEYAYVRSLYN